MKIKSMILGALSTMVIPVAVPLPTYIAVAGTTQCMDRDPVLANLVSTSKPPQSASSIVQMTNLMFVLDAAIASIDRNCRAEPDYASVRASYKQARDTAFANCKSLASNQAICVPTRYVRPGS